tara:strand:- start:953 stop:1369 length:417 start_codon:yes stop_codon:yes gene_type:complete
LASSLQTQNDPVAGKLAEATISGVSASKKDPPVVETNITGASSGYLFMVDIDNTSNPDEDAYICVYDSSGSPTIVVGTTTPDYVFLARGGTRKVYSVFEDAGQGIPFSGGLSLVAKTTGGAGGTEGLANDVTIRILSS